MSEKIKQAIARGAKVEAIPKAPIEVKGIADLTVQLKAIIEDQQKVHAAQTSLLIAAIDRLVNTVSEKEFNSKADMAPLVRAVRDLKVEAVERPEPTPWRVDFERDQRGYMKTGIMLTPFPMRTVN